MIPVHNEIRGFYNRWSILTVRTPLLLLILQFGVFSHSTVGRLVLGTKILWAANAVARSGTSHNRPSEGKMHPEGLLTGVSRNNC
jgi:hypothetical protein